MLVEHDLENVSVRTIFSSPKYVVSRVLTFVSPSRTELFTHYTEDNYMAPHPTPEIMRIPLEALCLQIKSMRSDEDVKLFLGKAIDPPDVRAIDSAWATLRLLGAIEEHGGTKAKLTPLGMHLAMIPVDLRLAKVRMTLCDR